MQWVDWLPPLFITLAGVSAMLFVSSKQDKDWTLVKRGAAVILFGYLLNVLTPGWFSWGSWFILHMIGFSIMTAPLIRRLSNLFLTGLTIVTLGISVFAQYALQTPLLISDAYMNDASLPGGLLRIILFEGHFPIFPWYSFFLGGVILARLLSKKRIKILLIIALGFVGIAGLFSLLSVFSFTHIEPFEQLFTVNFRVYPMHTFIFALCFPMIIFGFLLFRWFDERWHFRSDNPLSILGRATLSIYVLHIVLFKGLQMYGLLPTYGAASVFSVIAVVIGFFAIAAHFWSKINFRYGLEWLLRKLVPSKKSPTVKS